MSQVEMPQLYISDSESDDSDDECVVDKTSDLVEVGNKVKLNEYHPTLTFKTKPLRVMRIQECLS